jgi:phosphodiester glycosidase/F5/8 type C domain-containing protein
MMKKILLIKTLVLLCIISGMPVHIFAADAPPWIKGRAISPSITYQYRIEQRAGFHQQIHRVQIDLRSKNLKLEIVPSENFPFKKEYPGKIFSRKNALVLAPASLEIPEKGERIRPLGGLRFQGDIYSRGKGSSETRIRPLNSIEFFKKSDFSNNQPFITLDSGKKILLSGVNEIPQNPGFYLYTDKFYRISKEEMKKWRMKSFYILDCLIKNGPEASCRIRKKLQNPKEIRIHDNTYIILETGKKNSKKEILGSFRNMLKITLSDEKQNQLYEEIFCGGPYFLRKGKYDKKAVEEFCSHKGAPPLSHYEKKKERIALAMDQNKNVLCIFAVDKKGFSREGMTLEELAFFLIGEGTYEAIALPDGKHTSLILPDGSVNATESGVEESLINALCIMESEPEENEEVNILRRYPCAIGANGSEPRNPASALNDGSYSLVPSLDNYWEHLNKDQFSKPVIMIDLQKVYKINSIEIFHAEEAGFSSYFNCREFSIYGHEKNKNSMEEILRVTNPDALSCQAIDFPAGTKLRYLSIIIDKPTGNESCRAARIAEIILRGSRE